MSLISTPAQRVLASNTTNNSALALTGGRHKLSTLLATAGVGVVPLVGPGGVNARRGFRLGFIGTDAANETLSARLFQVIASQGQDAAVPTYVELRYWGLIDATLGAAQRVDASDPLLIAADEFIADTLTFTAGSTATTPDGVATDEEIALGSPGTRAYSPANDLVATLHVPDFGGVYGLLLEFSRNGKTAAAMNAWVEQLV